MLKRVLLIVDMEGISGIDEKNSQSCSTGSELWSSYGREALTKHVKQIIVNCRKVGVTEVHVFDFHDRGNSIIREELNVEKWYGTVFDILSLDNQYEGALLLGFHAMQGSNGILPHTLRPEISRLVLNGEQIGEIGLLILLLNHLMIPIYMITGDKHAVAETKKYVNEVESIILKERVSDGSICHYKPPSDFEVQEQLVRVMKAEFSKENMLCLRQSNDFEYWIEMGVQDQNYINDLKVRDLGEPFSILDSCISWRSTDPFDIWHKIVHLTKVFIIEQRLWYGKQPQL